MALILAAIVGPAIPAQAQHTEDGLELKNVVLKLKWRHQFQFAGYYAAREKGFYRDAGLAVSIVEASDFSESIEAVVAGEAQYGIGDSDLIVHRAKGLPVVALAAIFQHSPLVLVTKKNDIDHIHRLVNKRVMLEPHCYALLAYLKSEGVTVDQLVRHPHEYSPAALIEDRVDAMSAYATDEPYLLKKHGVDYQIHSPRMGGIDFYGDIIFTTEAQINEDRDQVVSFLEASMLGWEYALDHSEEIIDLIISDYDARHERDHLQYEAQEMVAYISPEIVPIGYMNRGRWKHIADTYAQLDMAPESFTLDGFLLAETARRKLPLTLVFASGVSVVLLLILLIGVSRMCRRLFLGRRAAK